MAVAVFQSVCVSKLDDDSIVNASVKINHSGDRRLTRPAIVESRHEADDRTTPQRRRRGHVSVVVLTL